MFPKATSASRRLAVALLFTLAGSAYADTKITVTFLSDPPGASIYQNGQQLGVAPALITYKAPGRFQECMLTLPVKVRWVSGAEVDTPQIQLCPAQGKRQQFTVFRPKGVDGIEVDVQYAIALLQSRSAAPPTVVPAAIPMPKFCTTNVIGSQIFTSCSP